MISHCPLGVVKEKVKKKVVPCPKIKIGVSSPSSESFNVSLASLTKTTAFVDSGEDVSTYAGAGALKAGLFKWTVKVGFLVPALAGVDCCDTSWFCRWNILKLNMVGAMPT
ncbi:predicted protein [Pyrenophora tritici-repentis Pt-1C-BFP]|uniref:Uncharacterized protein n=1 Tax=Pyrenophora tritici-repentis (strain Pt-1C-BFP) TaxID=426418 RepID=B2WJJ3_PYRTR|nr:uncharacterized protein PTRG_10339 [Pyrenophora tritici-repentis Pt-1C-BFP]EDU43390.1 predicted protein [Pyrenophora tritici-repentis Pt-1C-BFP]